MNNAEIAKCLAEVSALVAAGHPYKKCMQSRYVWKVPPYHCDWEATINPAWDTPELEVRVAKGFVEGKPVFEGDKLWCGASNHYFTVKGVCNRGTAFEYQTMYKGRECVGIKECLWNPPAPKVEIHKPATFELNGEVLPLPDYVGFEPLCTLFPSVVFPTGWWCYKSKDDADKVRAAFVKLTEGL